MSIALPVGPTIESGFRARISWAFFDWANQPFFTVITTFIFAPFFANILVGDPVAGQSYWGYTQSIAGVLIALLSPFLGAMADAGGPRKPYIAFFQGLTVTGCFLLWFAEPGSPYVIPLAMVALVMASVGAEFSIVFNNALLPTVAGPARIGRWSGIGWSMGYAGGLIALIVTLALAMPDALGIATPPGETLFGLDRASHEGERATGPFAALWLLIFVWPMFLFVPDAARSGLNKLQAARAGAARLLATVREARQYKNAFRFLLAHMLYNDGLAAVIAFGGVYAAGQFGWATAELGVFGILLTIFALVGALVGGSLDDRLGSKRTVQIALALVTLATVGILSTGRDSLFFFMDAPGPVEGDGLFASRPEQVLIAFAILLGIGMGPMQAASRTMIGRLAPAGMTTEFYGLFAFSGKATAFMAPFLIATLTVMTNSQAMGASIILVFLAAGFLLLRGVQEGR